MNEKYDSILGYSGPTRPLHSGYVRWENIRGLFVLIAVQAELPDFSL